MHIRQLVTILGICLSYAHAISVPVVEDSVQPIVNLVTAPHEVLSASAPELNDAQKAALRESPYLYSHQLAAGQKEAFNSLLYIAKDPHQDYTSLVHGSLLGYSHTIISDIPKEIKEQRLKIFRDSLYSRIHDIATQLGAEKWEEHSKAATTNLNIELKQLVLEFQKKEVDPAGDKEIIGRIEKLAAKFKDEHKAVLNKITQMEEHIKTHLPYNFNLGSMEYLSVQDVDSALKKTNVAGQPKAFPLNLLLEHEGAAHQLSPAPVRSIAAPAQLPEAPRKVASAA